MKNQQRPSFEIIEELARAPGFSLVTDFSARNMQGQRCVGIVTPSAEKLQTLIRAAKRRGLQGHAVDTVDLNSIVYWPQVRPEHNLQTMAINQLKDYLRGYGRGRVGNLQTMASTHGWQTAAERVLAERRHALLNALDDSLLITIAQGLVIVQDCALAVARELLDAENQRVRHD